MFKMLTATALIPTPAPRIAAARGVRPQDSPAAASPVGSYRKRSGLRLFSAILRKFSGLFMKMPKTAFPPPCLARPTALPLFNTVALPWDQRRSYSRTSGLGCGVKGGKDFFLKLNSDLTHLINPKKEVFYVTQQN
jgi:hypothetical protein